MVWKNLKQSIVLSGVLIMGVLPSYIRAQDLKEFEKSVTEFTLDNGLKFLVLERHQAPVVSFHTYADVGSVDEVKGITGMAHLFEHMAFKGSRSVGTRDYLAEAEAMKRVDEAFHALKRERSKLGEDRQNSLQNMEKRLEEAQEEASLHLVHDEFEQALIREGAGGLNASTSRDATRYILSMPSNKVELWMSLESDRFFQPVLREFYKERDVVMEERRLRTESQPVGRLMEEFVAVAYKAHPYGEPTIGHMSDLETMTREEAQVFYNKYYSPGNLTIAIVGDVDPSQIRELAQTYFGRIPSGPKPDQVETVEPTQLGERRVTIEESSQPFILMGYHKPGINHPDNAVFDAITDILGVGRTSRLYKGLVREKKIAVSVSAFQGFPGSKHPGLFVFYAVPSRGSTPLECEMALTAEIEKLKTELVSVEELEKAKTRARAGLIRALSSNSGLARQLTFFEVVTGDWKNLFTQLEQVEQVTADDIQRVAKGYFEKRNRTVGLIETSPAGE